MAQAGKRIDAPRLFRMVAEEALRDGRIDDREKEMLWNFARFLRLDRETASSLFRETAQRLKGSATDLSPLDPVGLYRRVMREAFDEDGASDAREAVLRGLRALLGISEEQHRALESETRPPAVRAAAARPLVELVRDLRELAAAAVPPDAACATKARALFAELERAHDATNGGEILFPVVTVVTAFLATEARDTLQSLLQHLAQDPAAVRDTTSWCELVTRLAADPAQARDSARMTGILESVGALAAPAGGFWSKLSSWLERLVGEAFAAGELSRAHDLLGILRRAPAAAGPEVAPARLRALLEHVRHESRRVETAEAWRACQEVKQLLLENAVTGGWGEYAGGLASLLLMGVIRQVPQRTRLVAAVDALEEAADEPAGGLVARRHWASALGAAGILLVESNDPRRLGRCLDRVERFSPDDLADDALSRELVESLTTLMATLAEQPATGPGEGEAGESWTAQRPFRSVDRDALAVRIVTSARSLLQRTEGREPLRVARDRLMSVIDPVGVAL